MKPKQTEIIGLLNRANHRLVNDAGNSETIRFQQ